MPPASRSRPLRASPSRPGPARAHRSRTALPSTTTTADQHIVCFDTATTGLHRGARRVEIAATTPMTPDRPAMATPSTGGLRPATRRRTVRS